MAVSVWLEVDEHALVALEVVEARDRQRDLGAGGSVLPDEHLATLFTWPSSVRPLNSETVPRTRTRSPGATSGPKPFAKTKMPSLVAGSASKSAADCST